MVEIDKGRLVRGVKRTIMGFTYKNKDQKTWNAGISSNEWSVASNWLPTGIPTSADNVVVSGTNVLVREWSLTAPIAFSSLEVGNQATPNNAIVTLATLSYNSTLNIRSKAALGVTWADANQVSPWSYPYSITIDQGGQMQLNNARVFTNLYVYGLVYAMGDFYNVLSYGIFRAGSQMHLLEDSTFYTISSRFNAASMVLPNNGQVYFVKSTEDATATSSFSNGGGLYQTASYVGIANILTFSGSTFYSENSVVESINVLYMDNNATLSGRGNLFDFYGADSGLYFSVGQIAIFDSNIYHNSSLYFIRNCSTCFYQNSNITFTNTTLTYVEQNKIFYTSSNVSINGGRLMFGGNTNLYFNQTSLSVKQSEFFSLLETSSLNAMYSDFKLNTRLLMLNQSKLYTLNSTFYVYNHILLDNATLLWLDNSTAFVEGSILSHKNTNIKFHNSQVSINGDLDIVGSMDFYQGSIDIKGSMNITCPAGISVGLIDSISITVKGFATIDCLTGYSFVDIFVGGELELSGRAMMIYSNIISSNLTKIGTILGTYSNITVLDGDLVVMPNSFIYFEKSTITLNSGRFLSDPSSRVSLINSKVINNNGLMLIDSELIFGQSYLLNLADLVITSNIVKNSTVNATQTFDNQGMMNVTSNIAIQIDFANSGNLSIGNSSNTNNLQVDGNFNTSSETANVGLVVKSATDFSSLNVSQTATLAGELTIRVVKNLTRENVTIPVMTYDNVQGSHSKINIITYDPETGEEDSSPACSISSNQGEKGLNVLISNCKEESLVSKLGAGAIAGIVIGCAAAVVLSFTLYHFRERIRLNIKLFKVGKETKMNNINQ
ncbi:hypothetical protein DFA_08711 [Cavenderia fasciculata]|uniref:Transmembrane protein n=1 Tax=Cavenderia fasciculata TaxID=261658 RepID=F4Q3V8_CACFS|nr:uncharacterized protein DFA_08711 [Cavenderia fasciculata]EGG17714.1 hypothetical protein DFA_08711 [Cavenderia fasciculata]|eukprot:XP_004356198.1 hypothetical protein DFA_08711 [Cavenderia fasciculata]